MTKSRKDDDETAGAIAAFATTGLGLAGAYALGGLFRERRSGLADLGPAPIGSDPWLLAQVKAAIAREPDLDASRVVVEAKDAIVTLRGSVANAGDVARVEAAARTVQGIKRLEVSLEAR